MRQKNTMNFQILTLLKATNDFTFYKHLNRHIEPTNLNKAPFSDVFKIINTWKKKTIIKIILKYL